MGISLVGVGTTVVQTGAAGTFGPLVGSGAPGVSATEAIQAFPIPFSCAMSGLTSAQGPITAPFTITARKNGASVTQTISDTAQTDSTHTDRYLPGDTIDTTRTAGAGGLQRMQAQMQLGFVHAQGAQALMTVTAGAAANPVDGTVNAEKLTPTAVSGNHTSGVGPCALSASGSYTHSAYVCQSGAYSQLVFYINDFSGGGGINSIVNLANGTMGAPTVGGAVTAQGNSITPVGGGWYLVTLSGKGFTTNTSAAIYGYSGGTTSFVGDGTSGYLVYGSQLDPGLARLQHATIYASTHPGAGAGLSASTVYYPRAASSSPGGQTVEANSQYQVGCAGLLSNMTFVVPTNATTASSSVVSRINGANGTQAFTIGAGLTGTFRDVVNADSLAVAGLFCPQISVGVGGSITLSVSAFMFTPTVGNQSDIFTAATTPSLSNGYMAPYASTGTVSTAAAAGVALGFPFSVTRFCAYVLTNTATSSGNINANKNGTNVAPSGILLGAGLTGWFVSGGGSTAFLATDLLCFFGASLLAGGTVTLLQMGMTLTTPASYPQLVNEAGAAADTSAGRIGRTSIVGPETGSAADVENSTATSLMAVTEAGAAADASSNTRLAGSQVTEAGSAADTTDKVMVLHPVVAEIGAGADLTNAFDVYTLVMVEPDDANASAVDVEDIGAFISAMISEAGAAGDVAILANGIFGAIVEATLGAFEVTDANFAPMSVEVDELGDGEDQADATSQYANAVIEPDDGNASAADVSDVFPVIPLSQADSGDAADVEDAIYTLFGETDEVGSAQDQIDALAGFGLAQAEQGDAQDETDDLEAVLAVVVFEAGAALDASDPTSVTSLDVEDYANATDFPDISAAGFDVVSEQAIAQDRTDTNAVALSDVEEAGDGATTESDTVLFFASDVEEAGAADHESDTLAVLAADVEEPAAAQDATDYDKVGVSLLPVVESAAAQDQTALGISSLGASVAEIGAASDLTDMRATLHLIVQEIGAALDLSFALGFRAYAQVLSMTARIIHAPPPP
jgi:hypothetical protein